MSLSKPYYRNSLLFVFALFWFTICYSQNFHSTNYTSSNELPNNSIRALFLDSQNFLWIGTENGLVHKENEKFTHYFEEDGLAMNNCWAIAEDQLNKMWFGSYGGGLSVYDRNRFVVLSEKEGLVHNEITKLFYYNDLMFVGTSDGVSVVDTKTYQIYSAKPKEEKLFRVSSFFEHLNQIYCTTYNSGIYQVVIDSNSIALQPINSHQYIYSAFKFGEHVYSSNKSFYSKSDVKNYISKIDSIPMKKQGNSIIWDYCFADSNTIYAAAWGIFKNDGGIYEIKDETFTSRNLSFGVPNKEIISVCYDSTFQKLYAGSKNAGLFEIDLSGTIQFIPSQYKNALGFAALKNTKATLYSDLLLIENSTDAIEIDKQVFKHWEADFLRNRKIALPKHKDYFYELHYEMSASEIKFYDIKAFENSFWVNTTIGLFQIDKNGHLIRYLPVHTEEFNFTTEGNLIETNPYEGLRVYQNLNLFEYTYFEKEKSNTPTMIVNSLNKGSKTYLLSVFSGLYAWSEGHFISYVDSGIWPEKKLKHITNFGDYIAVSNEFGDVFIIEDGTNFNIITKILRSDINGNSISFLESYQGNLLIGTEKGLTIYKDNEFLFINEEQGLKQPFLSAKVDDHFLQIGSDHGIYHLDLYKLEDRKQLIFDVKINSVKINNELIPIEDFAKNGKASLNYSQNTLQLTFLTNAHPYPNKLTYQYRLNPKSEWSEVLSTPEIFLPYLPFRNYLIEVKVNDLSTGLHYLKVVLNLSILPPVWKSWWFRLLVFFVIIAATYVLYRYRIAQNKKMEEERSLVKKRIEEVKMEALLAQMNPHFIFNAMNSIQKYIMENDVDNAVLFLGEFSKLIRKNLDHCTRPYIFLIEEIEYLESYILLEKKRFNDKIEVSFEVAKGIDKYSIEIPAMIIQPFIENVFVHAFPPRIKDPKLTIDFGMKSANLLICAIKDNGAGFSETSSKKLHNSKGILLIKERLKLMEINVDDALKITSLKNVGTSVVISIPIQR